MDYDGNEDHKWTMMVTRTIMDYDGNKDHKWTMMVTRTINGL